MKRLVAIIVGTLLCLPAWAETWRDDFAGNLNRWLKFEWSKETKWDVINGELAVNVKGTIKGRPIFEGGKVIRGSAGSCSRRWMDIAIASSYGYTRTGGFSS